MNTWDSCDRWIERFLDGEFEQPSAERDAFEKHLSSCSSCSKVRAEYIAVETQIGALPIDEPPSTLSMLRTFLEQEKQEKNLVPFTKLVPVLENGHGESADNFHVVLTALAEELKKIQLEVAHLETSVAEDRNLMVKEQAHGLKMRAMLAAVAMLVFVTSMIFGFSYILLVGNVTPILSLVLFAAIPMFLILIYYFKGGFSLSQFIKSTRK